MSIKEVIDYVAQAGADNLFGVDYSDGDIRSLVEDFIGKPVSDRAMVMVASRIAYNAATATGSAVVGSTKATEYLLN